MVEFMFAVEFVMVVELDGVVVAFALTLDYI